MLVRTSRHSLSGILEVLSDSENAYTVSKYDTLLGTTFHQSVRELQSIREALASINARVSSHDTLLSDAFDRYLQVCGEKASVVKAILRTIAREGRGTRRMRYREAIERSETGEPMEQLVIGMLDSVCSMAEDDALSGEKVLEVDELRSMIDKLSAMPPSILPGRTANNFISKDNSVQFNSSGRNSYQYNNTGSGVQFPNAFQGHNYYAG
ncbi:hypothetical protein F4777DRAFT_45845 [Nemania sp. FL0916]|nr:hypothetical protein F4777DRAFT_45845 [Nemania sp. FL0916]